MLWDANLFADSLKSYPRQAAAKLQAQKMQEVEQMISGQSLPADQSTTLNKIMAMHSGLSNQTSNNHTTARIGNNSSAAAMNNYQYLLRSSSLQNNDPLQPSTFSSANLSQTAPHLTKVQSFNGMSVQQQSPSNISFPHQNNNSQASQVNQHLEQHVIQQLLQEMMNNKGAPQQPLTAPNPKSTVPSEEVVGPAVSGSGAVQARMGAGPVRNDSGLANSGTSVMAPSRSNSFKSAANNNNSSSSSSSFSGKPDLLQNLHLPDLDQDILREFTESGIQWWGRPRLDRWNLWNKIKI